MMATAALSARLGGLGGRCTRCLRHIKKGGFDPFHEDLCLTRPRHANDYLLLWQALLHSCGERDHRHACLLRRALSHGAEESLAYTRIQSGGEEQQIRALKQLVDDPRGVGIEWPGLITRALKERTEGAPDHSVCAEDGYCGCVLLVVSHFRVRSLS